MISRVHVNSSMVGRRQVDQSHCFIPNKFDLLSKSINTKERETEGENEENINFVSYYQRGKGCGSVVHRPAIEQSLEDERASEEFRTMSTRSRCPWLDRKNI